MHGSTFKPLVGVIPILVLSLLPPVPARAGVECPSPVSSQVHFQSPYFFSLKAEKSEERVKLEPAQPRQEALNNSYPDTFRSTGHNILQGSSRGGLDEYLVNWDDWRRRVARAVWAPITHAGVKMFGQTLVRYMVTRDRHITITEIQTPDPTGESGWLLAAAIQRLDGDPLLDFPEGSKQTIHPNNNACIGLPMLQPVGSLLVMPGGTEHVLAEW